MQAWLLTDKERFVAIKRTIVCKGFTALLCPFCRWSVKKLAPIGRVQACHGIEFAACQEGKGSYGFRGGY